MAITQDTWLERHPYLRPVADFHAQVRAAAQSVPIKSVGLPNWESYASDYQTGIPLLWSSHVSIDFAPAEAIVVSLVENLASRATSERLLMESRHLKEQLCQEKDAPRRSVAWLFDPEAFRPEHPGLLRYLGWTALTRYLGPLVGAFGNWRDEERWLFSYCPTCGSPPAMAQLVGIDPGRLRLLSCGCCGTRWRHRRIGCPFCSNGDDHRLSAIAIEGEKDLRIDYCVSCRGYLKTYIGGGSEALLLADWTSLHLDLIAQDRGLKRLAASLYEV